MISPRALICLSFGITMEIRAYADSYLNYSKQ